MRMDMVFKLALMIIGGVLLVLSTTADLTGLSINNTSQDPVFGPIQIAATMVSLIVFLSGLILLIFWRPHEEEQVELEAQKERHRDQSMVQKAMQTPEPAERPPNNVPVKGLAKKEPTTFDESDLEQFQVDVSTYGLADIQDQDIFGKGE